MISPLDASHRYFRRAQKGEDEALAKLNDYTRAEQKLALHIEALGFDSQEFETLMLEQARDRQSEIPKVQEKHDQAKTKVIRLETRQENDAPATGAKRSRNSPHWSQRFASALATKGLWATAVSDDQPTPTVSRLARRRQLACRHEGHGVAGCHSGAT